MMKCVVLLFSSVLVLLVCCGELKADVAQYSSSLNLFNVYLTWTRYSTNASDLTNYTVTTTFGGAGSISPTNAWLGICLNNINEMVKIALLLTSKCNFHFPTNVCIFCCLGQRRVHYMSKRGQSDVGQALLLRTRNADADTLQQHAAVVRPLQRSGECRRLQSHVQLHQGQLVQRAEYHSDASLCARRLRFR